jgi:hypothetical protein
MSSFLKNSRFNQFLEGKDIRELLLLVNLTPLTTEEQISIKYLEYITLDIANNTSNLIPNIIRSIRLDLKQEDLIDSFSFNKDFIELEKSSKGPYFKIFSNLLIFITRLYLIRKDII